MTQIVHTYFEKETSKINLKKRRAYKISEKSFDQ